MSRSIDQRIVEMEFDNDQFERGISKSMDSLNSLDKTINNLGNTNGSSILDKLGSVFSGIDSKFGNTAAILTNSMSTQLTSAASQIEYRFSALQVAVVQIISNITNQLYGFVNNAVGKVTDKIVQGGINRAMNIENAHFMLQGLIDDEAQVQAIMDDAKDSVDGTAYSYDSAAKAASQFAATGMRAGEEMQTALKGITGIAATTNSQYEDISRIFTTVAGNGRLMGDQLLQLSSRGLNVAASLSDYFKKVKNGSVKASDAVKKEIDKLTKKYGDNEAAIRDMVSKGKISFSIFSEAMGTTFGEHAKKANETFNGALSNIGAALARTGAFFVSPLIEQNGELVQLFNAIRIKINEINKYVSDFAPKVTDRVKAVITTIKDAIEKLNVDRLVEKISRGFVVLKTLFEAVKNIFNGIKTVINPITIGFKEMWHSWGYGANEAKNLADKLVALTAKFKLTNEQQRKLTNGTKEFLKVVKKVLSYLHEKLVELQPTLENVWYGIKIGAKFIAEIIKEIWNWISSFEGIDISFGKNAQAVKDWLKKMDDAVTKGELISGALNKIKESFDRAFDGLTTKLSNAGEKLKSIFGKLGNIVKRAFENISLEKIIEGLANFSAAIFVFITEKVIPNLPKMGEYFMAAIHKIGEALDYLVKSAGFRDFRAFLESATIIGFVATVNRLFTGLEVVLKKNGKALWDFSLIGSKFNSFLYEAGLSLRKFSYAIQAKVIKDIAVAIAILAGSMLVLSLIDVEALKAPFMVITALIIELTLAVKNLMEMPMGMDDIKQGKGLFGFLDALRQTGASAVKYSTITSAIVSIGAALLMLAIGLRMLSKCDPKTLAVSFVVLSLAMWEIVGVFEAMKVLKLGAVAQMTAQSFFSLAVALGIVALSMKLISSIEPERLAIGIAGMAACIVMLCLPLESFYKLTSKKIVKMKAGIKVMEGMAVALAMIAGVVWLFGSMDIIKLAKGLGSVALVLGGLIFAMNKMKGLKAQTGAKAMVVMAGALMIISVAIKRLANLDFGKLLGSTVALGAMIAALVIAAKQMDQLDGWTGAASMLAMAVALSVIAGAIKKVGELSVGTIIKGILALGVALAGLVIASTFLGSAALGVAAFGGALIVLGLGIAAVGAGVWLVGAGFLMLEAAVVGLATAIAGGSIIIVEGIVAVIKGIATGIAESTDMITQAFVGIIESLCIALLDTADLIVSTSMQLVVKVLQALVKYGPTIADLFLEFLITVINIAAEKAPRLIEAIMNFFGAVWEGLKQAFEKVDPSKILKGAGIIAAFTTVAVALGAIPGLGAAALAGIAQLSLIVAAMVVLFLEIGILSAIPGVNWLVNKGGDLLEEIGVAIGRFVGGVIGGIGRGMSSQFPAICENIQKGLEALEIDESTVNGIKTLAEAMLIITAQNLLESITGWITGKNSFKEFGESIQEFGKSFKMFYDSVKGIDDPEKIEIICNAIKALAEAAAAIPNDGGLAGFVAGDNNIGDFGRSLCSFGANFKRFCEQVKGIDTSGVDPTAKALVAISDAANKIPNGGEGLWQFFVGDNDIGEFGRKLVSFGGNFSRFCEQVKSVQTEGVHATADGLKAMAVAAEALPDTGGWMQKFTGEGNLTKFGRQLASFGVFFSTFASAVRGTSSSDVTSAINCIKIMVEIAKSLDETYGVFNKCGELVDFGKKLADFAPYFAKFVKGIGEFSVSQVNAVAEIAKKFTDMTISLSKINTAAGSDLTMLGLQLEDIGNSLASFSVIVSAIDTDSLGAAMDALTDLVDVAKDISGLDFEKIGEFTTKMAAIGTEGVNGIIDSLDDSKISVPNKIIEAVDEYVKEIENQIDRVSKIISDNLNTGLREETFKSIAKNNVLGGLEKGLKDPAGNSSLKTASQNVGTAATNGTKNKVSKSAGKSIAIQFINGLIIGLGSYSSTNAVGRAGANVGAVLLDSLRKKLDSHSPSREAIKIGRDVNNGLSIGLDKYSTVVGKSAQNVGDDVLDEMRRSIDKINAAGLLGDDFRPVITPVLDLTDVKNQAGSINGMFDNTQIKMAADVNGLMNSYAEAARASNNITLNDSKMVEAITGLRRDVNAMGTQMSNLQVVMDSGALVGQIAKPMDNALGSRAIRNWREREA